MVDFACPTEEEIDLLRQHYRRTPGTVSQRAHTVLLSVLGRTPYDIAQILFLTEKTVREWIKLWHKERMASLFSKNHCNENAAKLTRKQKEEIKKVLAEPPSEHGLPKEFWEVKSLKKYLLAEFGIEYKSDNSYRFLFKLHHYSFHLPAKFDIHRNERTVQERIRKIREIIFPLLVNPHWEVLAADESRLIWEAIVRKAWLPKGKKTVLKVVRSKKYQNFFGCLNLKTGKPHLYQIPWQKTKEIIKILKLIKKEYPRKHLCLIWDNASFHRSKRLKQRLRTSLRMFYLLNLPPYAPDTNPQEHIWKYAKEEISNYQYATIEEMREGFKSTVMGRNYPYQI